MKKILSLFIIVSLVLFILTPIGLSVYAKSYDDDVINKTIDDTIEENNHSDNISAAFIIVAGLLMTLLIGVLYALDRSDNSIRYDREED